jgi:hypothetical protein
MSPNGKESEMAPARTSYGLTLARKRLDRSASRHYDESSYTLDMEGCKACYSCLRFKAFDDFYNCKNSYDKKLNQCKECNINKGQLYRENNREKERVRSREYGHQNSKIVQARVNRWRKDNPDKVRATRRKAHEKNYASRDRYVKEKRRLNAIRLDRSYRLKEMLACARRRALKSNIAFDLTLDDLIAIAHDNCAVSNKPLDWTYEQGNRGPMIPSLDKIVPELGYVKGNVAIIGHYWNMRKGALTIDEINTLQVYLNKFNLQ